VYVVPYPGPGERVTVSTAGGAAPRWSRNGRELFYLEGTKMMVVDIAPGAAFRPGKPRMLFENAGPYDVAPDGRFLMFKSVNLEAEPGQRTEVHVILNWIEELRQRVPMLE
jgi:hypothetical protein